ncbi:MAG TPA: glycogen debranching enzyme GlgX, partial [Aquimonas sp.]|nr:glycogen debranching enzyme GlgX [Aquimonas sp.]
MSPRLPEQLLPGRAHALGAQVIDGGVNFAVFSAHAERIELCLFDTHGSRELRRYALHGPDDDLFHGFLPDFGAGLVYGLRAYGPCVPEAGNRFNPHKLLLDPYAREIVGHFRWDDAHYGYTLGHPDGARRMDTRDNAAMALKARVAAPLPALRAPRPQRATAERVLYEVHVKGFSAECEAIPAALRGRYAGLAHPAAIAHFQRLGVTTLSLLPVHYALSEAPLVQRGQVNYWGYNTLGFFSA